MELKFKNFSKKYPYEKYYLIDSLSFCIKDGDKKGILFDEQSGKTTVAKCIAQITLPTSGQILLNGKPLREIAPRERQIAIVYDDFALMNNRSFWKNVAFPLKIRKIKMPDRKNIAIDALKRFDLVSRENEKVKKKELLSSDAIKLAFARASVRKFGLIVFDDIYKKVPSTIANELIDNLLKGFTGAELYLSSNIDDFIELDEILVMRLGECVFKGKYCEVVDFLKASDVMNFEI